MLRPRGSRFLYIQSVFLNEIGRGSTFAHEHAEHFVGLERVLQVDASVRLAGSSVVSQSSPVHFAKSLNRVSMPFPAGESANSRSWDHALAVAALELEAWQGFASGDAGGFNQHGRREPEFLELFEAAIDAADFMEFLNEKGFAGRIRLSVAGSVSGHLVGHHELMAQALLLGQPEGIDLLGS